MPIRQNCNLIDFLDVVKVRLMSDKERQLNGVMDCIRKIMAREGPLAFYKGFGMCWARVSVFVAVGRMQLTDQNDSWASTPLLASLLSKDLGFLSA